MQVFPLNIRHKCCDWPNNEHLNQILNLMSFSSSSGHRLIRGKVFGRRKGGRLLLPPQRGQTAESTAVYSHLTGTADYRNIAFISHLHHSLLAPSAVELLTSSVAKNNTKNIFNLWTQDQSARHGALPSQWGNFSAGNGAKVHQSSICWHGQQAQPKLIQNYHIHNFHRSFNSVKTLS